MYESIAYCGLDCDRCPAYLATQSGDMEALARVAERWTADTGREVRAEAILCDGCKSGSERINTFCAACEIRDCAVSRGLDNCAHCSDYACERLRGFIAYEGEGKANLDKIRRTLENT